MKFRIQQHKDGGTNELSSVRQSLFIMKLQSNVYHVNKQAYLEEGSRAYEETSEDCNSNSERKNSSFDRCLQLVNLMLYLELILFIGWMGGVAIGNYYHAQDPQGLDEQYGASEWSWDPESFDYIMDLNSVSPDTSERGGEETTTTKNGITGSVTARKNVTRDMESIIVVKSSAPDDTGRASMLPWLWFQSLTALKNAWTDDSTEPTSSDNESHGGTNETALSNKSDVPATAQDDKMEFDYVVTLPVWYNVDCTVNYPDKGLDPDGDLLQADDITNAIIVLETMDSPGPHRSRRTRSTSGPNEDSSLSFQSEESVSIISELLSASSEATSEADEYPTGFRNRGNVIEMSKDVDKYMGKNLAH